MTRGRALLACLAPLALLLASSTAFAQTLTGRVVGIADGDTLTVYDGTQEIRVRLADIDAPEKGQPFGTAARKHLSTLCYATHASIRVVDVDHYGRTIGRVTCGRHYANAEMVRTGLAWVYRRYARDASLYQLEAQARAARLQLWGESDPVPPWTFRRR